jgi:hypothetical protein
MGWKADRDTGNVSLHQHVLNILRLTQFPNPMGVKQQLSVRPKTLTSILFKFTSVPESALKFSMNDSIFTQTHRHFTLK